MREEKFWASAVLVSSGCREWQRSRDEDGYGWVWFEGKKWRAHRLAFFLSTGVHPGIAKVLHSCDNPPCIEASHLSLGSQAENVRQRQERGRTYEGAWRGRGAPSYGEQNGQAKLTPDTVRAIRAALASGETQLAVALRFGVSQMTVSNVSRRKVWGHVE